MSTLPPADSKDVTENDVDDDNEDDELVVQVQHKSSELETTSAEEDESRDSCCRVKIRQHRKEVVGRVWIPEIWGQEELLKDWVDCSVFDTALAPPGIVPARTALAEEGQLLRRGANAMLPHN